MATPRKCQVCGDLLVGARSDAKFCGDTCRSRAARGQAPKSQPGASKFVTLIESQLEAAGRLDSVKGQHALLLAQQLGAKVVNTSGMASLSKEFREVYAEAMAGVEVEAGDAVDELASRRQAKRRTAV